MLISNIDNGAVSNNTIGGTTAGARNVISGNAIDGVNISGNETTDNVVEGNYIGTNVTGVIAINNHNGVEIQSNANGNTVGGTTAGARNVISGNSNDGVALDSIGGSSANNTVAGNFIGVDSTGQTALPNANGVIIVGAFDNTIGGDTAGADNVISGNSLDGIIVEANNNIIEGNIIGTSAAGKNLGNGGDGILIQNGSTGNIIGGDAPGAGNVIAFNEEYGVEIQDTSSDNAILGNDIFSNSGGSIVYTSATPGSGYTTSPLPITMLSFYDGPTSTTAIGSFTDPSDPNTTFDIDFFANTDSGDGGDFFLGSATVATDASGTAYFNASWPANNFSPSVAGIDLPSADYNNNNFTATVTEYVAGVATNTSTFGTLSNVDPKAYTPPAVTISGPTSTVSGLPVTFSSTVNDAAAQPNLTYSWTVTGPTTPVNGTGWALPQTAVTTQPAFQFMPTMGGDYSIQLDVSDGIATVSSNVIDLVVGALGSGAVVNPLASAVQITGVALTDDVATLTTSAQPTFQARQTVTVVGLTNAVFNGTYEVSAVGYDHATGNYYFTYALNQADVLPTADSGYAGIPGNNIATGSSLTLVGDLAGSTGATPVSYNWTVNGKNVTLDDDAYQFTAAGVYTIGLSILDSNGNVSSTSEAVTVSNVEASIVGTPRKVIAGVPVTVSAGINYPGLLGPLTYDWTASIYGLSSYSPVASQDGSASTFTFTPQTAGKYEIELSVDGVEATPKYFTATAARTVPTQPSPDATLSLTPASGLMLTAGTNYPDAITAAVSGSSASYTYTWSVSTPVKHKTITNADGSSTLGFTPESTGTETVTVKAKAKNGSVLTASETFTVTPATLVAVIKGR